MLRSMPDCDDRVDDCRYSRVAGVGFGERGDALAEVVERQQQAARFERARRGDRFLDGFAGDEAPREAGRRRACRTATPAACRVRLRASR